MHIIFQLNEAAQGGDYVLFRACKQMIKVNWDFILPEKTRIK